MKNIKGLFVFSITNMIERFGFYAMMSILVFSFIEGRGKTGEEAGYLYTMFYSSIYGSMFLLGLAGDFFNRRKVIFYGLIAMAAGYFLYFLLSKGSSISLIIPGALVILGVGAFKTNLQVQMGDLYRNNIKNGVIGYIIFYAFINIGAVLAPFASVYLKKIYGVDTVFLLSGAVSLLALALYHFVPVSVEGEQELKNAEMKNNPEKTGISPLEYTDYGIDKIIGLIFLIILVPFFWAAFHQTGLTFNFYTRDFIDLNGNAPELIQSINPVAFILFSIIGVPILYYSISMRKIHSIFPFILTGMIIAALGYFIPANALAHITGKLPYSYAVIPVLLITLAELFISPFLMLGFYHYSPGKFRGLFIGLFMALTAIGNMFLFIFGIIYNKSGAAHTFNTIVIHILICAAAVLSIWFLLRKLNTGRSNIE